MSEMTTLNPMSLLYMKVVRFFLQTTDAWPSEVIRGEPQKFRFFQVFFIWTIAMVIWGELNYILYNFRILSFFLLGEVYVILSLTTLTWVRTIMPTFSRYGKITTYFLKEFHLIHFQHKGSQFKSMYAKVNKVSHYFTLVMTPIMIGAMSLFNTSPAYNNYVNGVFTNAQSPNYTLQFSVYCKWPGYDQNDHFILTTCMNLFLSYLCCIVVCMNDLYLTLIVFQIIGHIEVLKYNLTHFIQPTVRVGGKTSALTLFTVEENKFIHTKIKESVDHHRLIVSFTKDVSSFFGPMLGFTFLHHMIGCCLLLLECSSGEPDVLVRYGPLTALTFGQLIQLSVTFEVVGARSEEINNAVYSVPWESMDVRNQRSVYILLNNVQKPINVTAMGLMTVGVHTMLRILKTTVTYFAFLKSIDE